jgi:hypothetical protein
MDVAWRTLMTIWLLIALAVTALIVVPLLVTTLLRAM